MFGGRVLATYLCCRERGGRKRPGLKVCPAPVRGGRGKPSTGRKRGGKSGGARLHYLRDTREKYVRVLRPRGADSLKSRDTRKTTSPTGGGKSKKGTGVGGRAKGGGRTPE